MTSLGLPLDSIAMFKVSLVNSLFGESDKAQPIGLRAKRSITIAK